MTQNQFLALCSEHLIDPGVALENDALVQALETRDDEAVIHIIQNQF